MKKSKSMKVAEYFLKYPNAVPKDVNGATRWTTWTAK